MTPNTRPHTVSLPLLDVFYYINIRLKMKKHWIIAIYLKFMILKHLI